MDRTPWPDCDWPWPNHEPSLHLRIPARPEPTVQHSIEYRGYEIVAKPKQLKTGWSVEIDIVRQEPDGILEKHFDAANTFPTEEQAVAHCFEFGRRIIDGQVPEITTSELP